MEKLNAKRIGGLFKTNWVYLLWVSVYLFIAWALFGATLEAFMYVVVIYGCSIAIALSPVGEVILRFVEGARPMRTNEEIQYLQPLFEEVYTSAKEIHPNLSNNIQLFIIDKGFINAFAMGRNTIAITKPAIQTFTEDELKGIIAHEFGHIAHGDTKALLLNVVGNGLFSIFIVMIRIIMLIMNFVSGFSRSAVAMIIIFVTNLILNLGIIAFGLIGQIILSINERNNEYLADHFSYQCGCGDGLINALYILQKISMPANVALIDKLRASHPHLAKRIQRLENIQEA